MTDKYKWVLEAYELLEAAKWDLDVVRSEYESELSSDLCEKIEGVISDICDIDEQLCVEAKIDQNEVTRLVATKDLTAPRPSPPTDAHKGPEIRYL